MLALQCSAPAALLGIVAAGCATSAPTPAVPPPTPGAYRAELGRASDRVTRALEGIRRDREQDDLAERLSSAASRFDQAARGLAGARPLRAAGRAHTIAIAGLRGLAEAAAIASDDADARKLCTSRAALADLARSQGAERWQVAKRLLNTQGLPIPALGLDRGATAGQRPVNGAILGRAGHGTGRLTITDLAATDMVVRAVDGGNRVGVYMRSGGMARVSGLPDGDYRVFVASGHAWAAGHNTFSRNCRFSRLDGTMRFRSTPTTYTTFRLGLNTAHGEGNTSSSEIDPAAFPR